MGQLEDRFIFFIALLLFPRTMFRFIPIVPVSVIFERLFCLNLIVIPADSIVAALNRHALNRQCKLGALCSPSVGQLISFES